MGTIRANCQDCGDVELTTKDVHVRVCEDTNDGTYSFRCPVCNMIVVHRCEIRTVDLLIASGVSYENWKLPQELFEENTGDPINHDDLLDFHEALADDKTVIDELEGLINR